MILLYLVLFLIFISSLRKSSGKWNCDYISKDTSNILKGVCIWIVFICHISAYLGRIENLPVFDTLLFVANSYIKQLLVVPFLFFSGYGVTLAIKKKGSKYGNNILYNRCLPTLLNFDVAVFFFLIMNIILQKHYDFFNILLAFVGWESIGNSNWYIFCIILCYAMSWLSFKIFGYNTKMLLTLSGLVIIYSIIMFIFSEGPWWYDSVYSYAGGAIFAYYKDKSEIKIVAHYWTLAILSIIGFLFFYNLPTTFGIAPNISGLFLCIMMILFTSKVRLKSIFLEWSGRHLFPLYIYQRLPMIALASIGGGYFLHNHYYLYIALCLIVTLIIAYIYKYIDIRLNKRG